MNTAEIIMYQNRKEKSHNNRKDQRNKKKSLTNILKNKK